ncbi:MAG: hypothetical protein JW737_08150 [Acidobacteria bacterium]|nr:hypothetical protein [Acidobacteriota bacterium]
MKNLIKKIINDKKGIVLITLLLFSMMLLSLGLTMLYQSDSQFQLSVNVRNNTEVFMVAETAYDSAVARILYLMESQGYIGNFNSARPGNMTGWPNYLIRVYDDPTNPSYFRLVEQPEPVSSDEDFFSDDVLNRDLSAAYDVTDDSVNPANYLITRSDSISGSGFFKVDDKHFYRAWLESDRFNEKGGDEDHTAFLMVEAFRGDPNAPVDPNDSDFRPQWHVLMQYRIRLVVENSNWESEDVAQTGQDPRGSGSTQSTGSIDITSSGWASGARSLTETD